jgi:cation transporter-like permease
MHVTEPRVATGLTRFVTYLERQLVDSTPAATTRVQRPATFLYLAPDNVVPPATASVSDGYLS